MQNNSKLLLCALSEFILFTFFISIVPLIVALDTIILGGSANEYSFTELSQEALLLVVSIAFGVNACKRPEQRPFLVLSAAAFTSFLIRECDIFFDFIHHGLWQTLVIALVFVSIIYAFKNREALLELIVNFTRTKSYTYFLVGLSIILAFSRLFGTGKLWIPIMGDDYNPHYKSVIQEGLELFGYIFIAYGTYLYLRSDQQCRNEKATRLQ